MSGQIPHDKRKTPPDATPEDGDADGSRNGSGAQTALLAMLKKRNMRVTRDADSDTPADEARDPSAE